MNHAIPARKNAADRFFVRTAADKKIFCPGGRRNRLKKLKTAKDIQGNPSLFPGFSLRNLAGLGWAWQDLDRIWIRSD